MAAALKLICVMGLVVLISLLEMGNVGASGECGKASPDNEAMKLAPCAEAAQDENSPVSSGCCAQVKKMGQNPNPKCLCAVMLSNTAKASGIKPEVAVTIPKRCNIANRPGGLQMRSLYTSLK